MRAKTLLIAFFILYCVSFSWTQNVSISQFEVESNAKFIDNVTQPSVSSVGVLSARFLPIPWIRIEGGVSFSIPDSLRFFHGDPTVSKQGTILFNNASIEFFETKTKPVTIAFFTGVYSVLNSDSLMRTYLKEDLPAPEFHYKPAGSFFNSSTTIAGSGMAFSSVPSNGNTATSFSLTWNNREKEESAILADIRLASVGSVYKVHSFFGYGLIPSRKTARIRSGASALFGEGSGNELFVEATIKRLTVGKNATKALSLLFESRIKYSIGDITFSFFSSPLYETNASLMDDVESLGNFIGANILVGFGSLKKSKNRGGISILGSINPENPGSVTPFSFSVSPFYAMMIADFLFETTMAVNPLLIHKPAESGELRVSCKVVY